VLTQARISIPGKTFIAGEYLALVGGPALVLATNPRFSLTITARTKPAIEGLNFHPDGPSGKFLSLQSDFFKNWDMSFNDPYSIGGFGASSAQFALLHLFYQKGQDIFGDGQGQWDLHQMLQDYRQLSSENKGFPPSGADIVGAVSGGITWFERSQGRVQTFSWPFQEIEFFVLSTGQKVPTHEHLQGLSQIPEVVLSAPMLSLHEALSRLDWSQFLRAMRQYRDALWNQGWCAEHSQKIVKTLENHSEVLLAKGCGALGADVVIVFCEKSKSPSVRALIDKSGLKIVASSSDVSPGIQVELSSHQKEVTL